MSSVGSKMAASLGRSLQSKLVKDRVGYCCRHIVTLERFKARRGKHPDVAKTFEERLKERNESRGQLPFSRRTNIGFKVTRELPERKEMRQILRKGREELEQDARFRKLELSLDTVEEEWKKESGPIATVTLAEHYGIFRDLFHDAYFYPSVYMNVFYDCDEEFVLPVYRGNILQPKEVKSPPQVRYPSDSESLWTLLMTAPDSHLQTKDAEYLHWMIGNIPGNDISQGEELCNYLPVFPVKGTGVHRYIFLLFKQNEKIDFASEKRPSNCISLVKRTFCTAEFYKKYEDVLTPAGISFFQCEYDASVRDVFWDVLDMKEPSFEFVHPPPFHPAQKKYPGKQAFDRYLDRYKDKKEIHEEVLREKFKTLNPFKPKPPPSKYANIAWVDKSLPSWLKLKNTHKRLRRMHYKDLD